MPFGSTAGTSLPNNTAALLQALLGQNIPGTGQVANAQPVIPQLNGNGLYLDLATSLLQMLPTTSPSPSLSVQNQQPKASVAAVQTSPKQRGDGQGSPEKKERRSEEQSNSSSSAGEEICVPCRARGMPSDHNFRTAHFIIPRDIQHGQDLVCSYPACRDLGVKFRYCLFCRVPVAKRNFCLRHSHSDDVLQPAKAYKKKVPATICVEIDAKSPEKPRKMLSRSDRDDLQAGKATSEAQMEPRKSTAKKRKSRHNRSSRDSKVQVRSEGYVDETMSIRRNRRDHQNRKKKRSRRDVSEPPQYADSKLDSNVVNESSSSKQQKKKTKRAIEEIDDRRLLMWSSLLGKRPVVDNDDDMSKWLMKVMAISDFNAPLHDATMREFGLDDKDTSSSPSTLTVDSNQPTALIKNGL